MSFHIWSPNQSLIDRMGDPEGSVSVTGAVNDEIKFMQGWYDPFSEESSVYITNYKWNMFQQNEGPIISVNMNNYSQEEWGWNDYLNIYFNNGNYIEIEQEIDYSFNGKTLNIPSQTLIHSDDVIDTVFGETNTIVIKRVIENNKRSTLTWYAVDHDFIPVKIEQYRKKSLKFTVYLDKINK